jgi:hypothetical protein
MAHMHGVPREQRMACCTVARVQGNCANVDANSTAFVEQLPVLTAGRVEYPPLKPYQCVLLVNKSFLLVNNGSTWFDNLFLAVARNKAVPNMRLLEYGSYLGEFTGRKQQTFLTNVTFAGEGRGTMLALGNTKSSSMLVQGAHACTDLSRSACAGCVSLRMHVAMQRIRRTPQQALLLQTGCSRPSLACSLRWS